MSLRLAVRPKACQKVFLVGDLDVSTQQLLAHLDVLIVDDDPDARELMRHLLQFFGAKAIAVEGPEAARCYLAANTPHVIISDICMPDEDGHSFIRAIRALQHDAKQSIPTVALTALGGPAERQLALDSGFDVHLTKPVQPWVLAGILRELVPLSGRNRQP
jgi:CheY-like chemotaxis protein